MYPHVSTANGTNLSAAINMISFILRDPQDPYLVVTGSFLLRDRPPPEGISSAVFGKNRCIAKVRKGTIVSRFVALKPCCNRPQCRSCYSLWYSSHLCNYKRVKGRSHSAGWTVAQALTFHHGLLCKWYTPCTMVPLCTGYRNLLVIQHTKGPYLTEKKRTPLRGAVRAQTN